ncbi:MAG: ADP-ribosylation factor-like protein [Candidatus Helarchaeota archaeon]|nr:ADP-ribosylation factor-like protein [Candidatus Helarchaeota archaeon]
MPFRENQTIVFNIFLYGPQGSGKKTFIQWFVQNGNLLDANFLKSIKIKHEKLTNQITKYLDRIRDLPRLIKKNIDELIQNQQYKEAEAYFEESKSKVFDLIKISDQEIDKSVAESLTELKIAKSEVKTDNNLFSFIDIVGSTPSMIYRIYYPTDTLPNSLELSNFLSNMDGFIFIWDAQQTRIEDNQKAIQQIFTSLATNAQIPFVFALNKVDLPQSLRVADVRRLLAEFQFEEKVQTSFYSDSIFHELTIFETIGTRGINLTQVLRNCVRIIVLKNQAKIQELQSLLTQEEQEA